ncbi:hypothetical protein [Dactylosporangium sp. NPDC000521]|uniref:hypothetical protein n=1 Tax=Dactylosporangium sp. NPDC000521 TaxID=3363975 RepID=UPI0036CD6D97
MDWPELLMHVEHRLGMYVGLPTYDRACALITGFELARGRGELTAFQRWMAGRHHGSNLTFSALILVEALGGEPGMTQPVTDEEHQAAVRHLCLRLHEFLDLDPADPPPPAPLTAG